MIFEAGILFLGFMYVVSKYLDLMLRFAQYSDERDREEKENKMPECVKHIYN
jgi:hypothetical protein